MAIQASELQGLIKEPSSDARAEVANKIASGFISGEFSANERNIAVEIFRLLANDAEIRVRRILGDRLAASMGVPHDVIIKLSQDVNEVALPVLEKSFVLTEADLIGIANKSQDVLVMSAIARREMVSQELSQTLINKSNAKVAEVLLKNKNANISEKGFDDIFQFCADDTGVLEVMAYRNSLPLHIAEKLFVAVSEEVKAILTKQYNISLQAADDSANYARELATLGLIDQSMGNMDLESLVDHLNKNGRLSFSIVMRSLCLGNLRFFEHALSKLSNVPLINARILVLDQGIGFESLYTKSGLPLELLPAVRYLLQIALEETKAGLYQRNDFRKRLLTKLVKDKEATQIEYMDYIVTVIQNNGVASRY